MNTFTRSTLIAIGIGLAATACGSGGLDASDSSTSPRRATTTTQLTEATTAPEVELREIAVATSTTTKPVATSNDDTLDDILQEFLTGDFVVAMQECFIAEGFDIDSAPDASADIEATIEEFDAIFEVCNETIPIPHDFEFPAFELDPATEETLTQLSAEVAECFRENVGIDLPDRFFVEDHFDNIDPAILSAMDAAENDPELKPIGDACMEAFISGIEPVLPGLQGATDDLFDEVFGPSE